MQRFIGEGFGLVKVVLGGGICHLATVLVCATNNLFAVGGPLNEVVKAIAGHDGEIASSSLSCSAYMARSVSGPPDAAQVRPSRHVVVLAPLWIEAT